MTDYTNMSTIEQVLGMDQQNRNARKIQTDFMGVILITHDRFFSLTKRGIYKMNHMFNVEGRLAYVSRSTQFFIQFIDTCPTFDFSGFMNQFIMRSMMSIWNDHGQYQQNIPTKVFHYSEEVQEVNCRNRSKTKAASRYASVSLNEEAVAHKSDVAAKRTEPQLEAKPYTPSRFQMANPEVFPPNILNDNVECDEPKSERTLSEIFELDSFDPDQDEGDGEDEDDFDFDLLDSFELSGNDDMDMLDSFELSGNDDMDMLDSFDFDTI